MGSDYERAQETKRKNGAKRGSVNNKSRLAALQPEEGAKGAADWGSADPRAIAAVVAAATLRGMIISFKLSRDGGAHGLDLYDDGEKASLWFNGGADLDIELEKVLIFLESVQ